MNFISESKLTKHKVRTPNGNISSLSSFSEVVAVDDADDNNNNDNNKNDNNYDGYFTIKVTTLVNFTSDVYHTGIDGEMGMMVS
jgi:hypothetical protein